MGRNRFVCARAKLYTHIHTKCAHRRRGNLIWKQSGATWRRDGIMADVLRLLAAREHGLDPPWVLPRLYGGRMFAQLELSRVKDCARLHHRPVTALDVECQAGR